MRKSMTRSFLPAMLAAGLALAWPASAQSPGCQRSLRQAQSQPPGDARLAALRRVAANCRDDPAGREAARLAGPSSPSASQRPNRSEAERQARLTERRQRDEANLAEERRREEARREARRQEDFRRREETRREEARQAELRRRQRQQEQAQQPASTPPLRPGHRRIEIRNACADRYRVRVVYSYQGQYSTASLDDVIWTVNPRESAMLTYGGMDISANSPLMYIDIVSPAVVYGNPETREFVYGRRTVQMHRIDASVNSNGAFQLNFC